MVCCGGAGVVVMWLCGVILYFDVIFCCGMIFRCGVLSCDIVDLVWYRVILCDVALLVYCVLEARSCIFVVWFYVVCNLV